MISQRKDKKLDRLCLGKTVRKDGRLKIEKISWDIHWQTDRFLAMIIRDYLNFFADNTPAVGNIPETVELAQTDVAAAYDIWINKVKSVAQEFDNILSLGERIGRYDSIEEELNADEREKLYKEMQAAIPQAFDGLKEIFNELCW